MTTYYSVISYVNDFCCEFMFYILTTDSLCIKIHITLNTTQKQREYHINLQRINALFLCITYAFMVYGVFALKLLCTSRYPKTLFIDLYMQVYLVFCCNQMPKTVPHNRLSKYIDIYIVTLGNCQQYDKTIL